MLSVSVYVCLSIRFKYVQTVTQHVCLCVCFASVGLWGERERHTHRSVCAIVVPVCTYAKPVNALDCGCWAVCVCVVSWKRSHAIAFLSKHTFTANLCSGVPSLTYMSSGFLLRVAVCWCDFCLHTSTSAHIGSNSHTAHMAAYMSH